MKKRLRTKSVRNNAAQAAKNVSENGGTVSNLKAKAKKPKGRIGKRRVRRPPTIDGLDILHQKTLQSTSPQGDYDFHSV